MTVLSGIIAQSFDESRDATLRVAAQHGYALAEKQSGPNVLAFKKGPTLISWGSGLTVHFDSESPTLSRLTISTRETFAITDWGRGKRAALKLLDELGADHVRIVTADSQAVHVALQPESAGESSFYCRTCRGIFWTHSPSCPVRPAQSSHAARHARLLWASAALGATVLFAVVAIVGASSGSPAWVAALVMTALVMVVVLILWFLRLIRGN